MEAKKEVRLNIFTSRISYGYEDEETHKWIEEADVTNNIIRMAFLSLENRIEEGMYEYSVDCYPNSPFELVVRLKNSKNA